MLDYHQMTMGQPRDTPQQRKQYLVICLIMAGYGFHSAINAGLFASLDIKRGMFPGGEFAYKSMTKDYVASGGTLRTVAHDLGMTLHEEDEPGGDGGGGGGGGGEEDLLYAVFFDDERLVPGGKTRYAGGALLSSSNNRAKVDGRKAAKRRLLVDANERIATLVPEEGGTIMSRNVLYEVGNLPKVEAAMAYHPYSGGAWSAMLQSYKVSGERGGDVGSFASSIFFRTRIKEIYGVSLFFFPRPTRLPRTATLAHLFRPILHSPPPPLNKKTMNKKIIPKFRKYAEEHGESGKSPVVVVTCSFEQKMCTYYVVSIVFLLSLFLLLVSL